MGRVKTVQDPSIESLLDSIRRAIHDDNVEPEDAPAINDQPVLSAPAAKPILGGSPLPGKAWPAPLRPVQPHQSALPPAQPESPGVRPLRPVQTRPGQGMTGAMREMRVSLATAAAGPGALSARTDDFLALRKRLAN